jgi:hypothetical protein
MEYTSNISLLLISFGMMAICILLGKKISSSDVFNTAIVDYYKTVKPYSERTATISIKLIAPMLVIVYILFVNLLLLAWVVIFTNHFDNFGKGVYIISCTIQVLYPGLVYWYKCDNILLTRPTVNPVTPRSEILNTMNTLYKQKDLNGLILLMHSINHDPKIGVFTRYVLLALTKRLIKSVKQFNDHSQQGIK